MTEREPAGFWIRFGAMILDGLIVGLPLNLLMAVIGNSAQAEDFGSNLIMFLYSLLIPVIWNGYTIGKRICGIRIAKVDDGSAPTIGTMLLRTVVAGLVYAITLGIAVLVSAIMVAVREDKRSIHDMIAGTQVVRH